MAELTDLALAQGPDRRGQQRRHLGAERGGDLRGPGQQEVAGHDGDEVAPAGVDAFDSPPGPGLVHDVVVVQRSQMDELHRRPPHHDRVGGRRGQPGASRGQGQGRAQALATGSEQVAGDLGEEGILALDGPPQGPLDSLQVVGERREGEHRGQAGHDRTIRQQPGIRTQGDVFLRIPASIH